MDWCSVSIWFTCSRGLYTTTVYSGRALTTSAIDTHNIALPGHSGWLGSDLQCGQPAAPRIKISTIYNEYIYIYIYTDLPREGTAHT